MGVALALDANQKSHVVAWDEQENKLYYHTDASGSWTSEAVDIPQPSDPNEVIKHWQNSIALDPDGSPAIATCGNSQWGLVGMGQLVYASRNSQWSARQLASFAATTFCRPALVFNGADPHIAYFHSFNYGYEQGFLTYWRLAGGKWQAEFVAGGAPGEQHGWGPDLAVDADGAEYIIYSEAAATMLATGSFHDWTRETIRDQGLELDYPMALTLNNGDLVVAIPYGDQWVDVTIGLRHNGVWTFKSFDHGLIYGAQGIDIAVAPDGWIHVVYTGDYAVWHAQISPEYLLRGGRTP
jgi:hypothetical protein